MTNWFTSLELFSQVYWSIALLGSLIFIVVMAMAFIGGDADGIGDSDMDFDGDVSAGFQFISFKNLVGFFTIFGWAGIACLDAGINKPTTVILSIIAGLLMMFIMASLFYSIKKLADSGTLNYKNAINGIGEVYLTIGAQRSQIGKVTIKVQGTVRELDAITDSLNPIPSGVLIKVIDVTSNGILIVAKSQKTIQPLPHKNAQLLSE